jgi:hypothetical protein
MVSNPTLLHCLILLALGQRIAGWLPLRTHLSVPSKSRRHPSFSRSTQHVHFSCSHHSSKLTWLTRNVVSRLQAAPVIDADFERVQEGNRTASVPSAVAAGDDAIASKSLFQLSLDADPDWNETRIPFMDGRGNFIDVKLAFMATLDGVQYGIGVPFDHAAALTVEQKDGTTANLSPDDEESEELIQIMAGQLQEHVGTDLSLKRTPRILTITGPLEEHTQDWKDKVLPQPVDTKTLLDDTDEDLDSFHNFMKKELGEEEYKRTLQEDAFDIDDELLELFGEFGEDGSKRGTDLFPDGLDEDDDKFIKEMDDFLTKGLSHDGVALKLISYSLPDGNTYSLVQLLQSYALVGKYHEDGDDIRFDLLSPDEASLLVPRLEEVCRDDLTKAGLTVGSIAN